MSILTIISQCENQAERDMLQEKAWVLGTRTPACGGMVRLLVFSEIKAYPDESGSQCCMQSISV